MDELLEKDIEFNKEFIKTVKNEQPEQIEIGKYCVKCNMPIAQRRKTMLCSNCAEAEVYVKVREYIRRNDVTEFEVANYFRIPLRLVKKWIVEGRIEYKPENGVYDNCVKCGKMIPIGKYCEQCQKEIGEKLGELEPPVEDGLRKQVIQDIGEKSAFHLEAQG